MGWPAPNNRLHLTAKPRSGLVPPAFGLRRQVSRRRHTTAATRIGLIEKRLIGNARRTPIRGGRWRERETCLLDHRLSVALRLWNGSGEVRGAAITGSLSFHVLPPILHAG